jgi:hypothetical protein
MKKLVALIAVLFSVVSPVQSQAASGEKIVIIDSYFDASAIPGSVEFVCVASDRCINKTGSNRDHGTQMAQIARQQNPTATLVLIQSATVSKKGVSSEVNLLGLIAALDFVNANASGVSAVSFSRYINNSSKKYAGQCFPQAVAPYTPETGFNKVKSSVVSLNSKGIQVYAAAGNNNKKPVDFPACVSEVVSVGSTGQSYFHQDANILDVVGTIVQANKLNYITINSLAVEFSTSFATAAIAAKYSNTSLASKKVDVLF